MRLDITYHKPTLEDKDVLLDYVEEHIKNGETHISSSLGLSSMRYEDWLIKIDKMSKETTDGWGRSDLYMICFNDHLVGLINIRYEMSEHLRDVYGNIGYGIRPSARKNGFATEALRFGLKYCKDRGLHKVVLGCLKSNVASAKTMLRCGGQLIKETLDGDYKPGQLKQYYQFRLEDENTEPEFWDLYDKDRNIVATDHKRGVWPIPDDMYHLVVHVWLKNKDGKYMIAQRSAKRAHNPLKWECHGGAVTKGEDSFSSAIREVFEEVGIKVDPKKGRLVFSRLRDVVNGERYGDIMDVWLFDYDGEANLLDATTDEVAQAHWATVEEIKELYESGEFVHTLGYFFEKIAI